MFAAGYAFQQAPIGPVAAVVTLSVDATQEIRLAGEAVAVEELEQALGAHAQDRALLVVMDIAPEAPVALVFEVIRVVREADVAGVNMEDTRTRSSEEVLFYPPAIP